MGFLAGKRALIVGLASNRSIAWGIAQAMHREGAELAFTYQNVAIALKPIGQIDKPLQYGLRIKSAHKRRKRKQNKRYCRI